jgi:hypothetical protein
MSAPVVNRAKSGAPWQSGWGLAKTISGTFERRLQVTGLDPSETVAGVRFEAGRGDGTGQRVSTLQLQQSLLRWKLQRAIDQLETGIFA